MPSTLERPAAIPKKLHGYEEQTTDALVAELSAVRDELAAECDSLRARVEELEAELAKRARYDRSLRDVFVSAQRESELMRSRAEREAAEIVAQAGPQAAVDTSLDEERERIRARIAAIHALEGDLRASTKALLLEALRRLDDPESAAEPLAPAVDAPLPAAEGRPSATGSPVPEATGGEPRTALAAPPEPAETAPAGPLPVAEAPAQSFEDDTIDMPVVAVPEEAAPVARAAESAPVPADVREERVAPVTATPGPAITADVREAALPASEAAEKPPRARTPWLSGARRSSLAATLAALGIVALGAAVALLIWQLRSEPAPSEPTAAQPAQTIGEETTAEAAAPAAPATVPSTEASAGQTATEAPATEAAATEAPATEAAATDASTAASGAGAPAQPQASGAATVVLRAAGGDCWLSVRRGSANGELLFEGFLFQGETRRFEGRRVWMRIGNPSNLVARLDGKPVELPSGTADVLVTSRGVQTLALG